MKFEFHDEEVRAYISDDEYYCTNKDGQGLFHVIISKNSRYQLIGHCDFSVRGLKPESKKAKIRRAIPRSTEDD